MTKSQIIIYAHIIDLTRFSIKTQDYTPKKQNNLYTESYSVCMQNEILHHVSLPSYTELL